METKEFLSRLDHQRISSAIAEAERRSSGEIRVFVQRGDIKGEALVAAERRFVELGMTKTAQRNAILIFVAPQPQKFAVVGDEGVHRKCGPDYWQQLVEGMRAHFKRAEFTDAIVEAIESAGALLARYFPCATGDCNELPDAPVEEG